MSNQTSPANPQPEPSALERFKQGRVLRCRSEKHGTHDLLCVKSPGIYSEDRLRFMSVNPDGETRELLFLSSVERDLVEKEWANLADYYQSELSSARAANAELLRDHERMEWLRKNTEFRFTIYAWGTPMHMRENYAQGVVIRPVIDAAMEKLAQLRAKTSS